LLDLLILIKDIIYIEYFSQHKLESVDSHSTCEKVSGLPSVV